MGRELDGNEPDHCLIGSHGVEIMARSRRSRTTWS